jgi:hypothetical protein
MLISNVLEVVTGMIACFASISLIASSLQEASASIFRLRARILLTGINQILNGQSLVVDIYNHALVNPRGDGKATSLADISRKFAPSYIDPLNFARALIDSLQGGKQALANLRQNLESIADPQLRQCLCGLYDRANANAADFEASVAQWFDAAMDRVSGSYKRQAQFWTFVFALLVAVVLNIDAYRIMTSLWGIATHSTLHLPLPAASDGVDGAMSTLTRMPIGWAKGAGVDLAGIAGATPGWIVAATSALFGAPFWFGLLGRVATLRSSGDRPSSK